MTPKEIAKKLSKLGGVEIRFSTYTCQFYVAQLGVEKKSDDQMFLSGICEHRDTPNEALDAYFNAIVDKVVVFGAYTQNRKEYRYNGNEFIELKQDIKTEG